MFRMLEDSQKSTYQWQACSIYGLHVTRTGTHGYTDSMTYISLSVFAVGRLGSAFALGSQNGYNIYSSLSLKCNVNNMTSSRKRRRRQCKQLQEQVRLMKRSMDRIGSCVHLSQLDANARLSHLNDEFVPPSTTTQLPPIKFPAHMINISQARWSPSLLNGSVGTTYGCARVSKLTSQGLTFRNSLSTNSDHCFILHHLDPGKALMPFVERQSGCAAEVLD
jgi:hypothetical protein